MKKIVLIIISLLLFFPIFAQAEVDYDITHYYINANILEDGDLKVTELIVLKGSFNGYIRDIVYKNSGLESTGYASNKIYNASNIEIIEVAAKKEKEISFETINDQNYTLLNKGQASNYGYLENNITNGKSYKMYFKSNNEQVAFRITYLIKDVIVLHNDVAELYWTFIGNEYEDTIRDLKIKVNLPGKDSTDLFRIWAHGEISGEINQYDNSYLMATVNRLEEHSSVDIRTTFSPSLIDETLVSKKTYKTALEGIIEVETERAEQANKERARVRTIYYALFAITIIYYIALIIAWIYIYLKYDKEYKKTFTNEYNREFIDDYNVEVVDYLINKNITPNAMSASIMNLIYKKIITLEEIPSEKKKKEYKFILEENREGINDTEQYLIDFLFTKVGKENVFTTIDLKNYAKGTKTCEKFSASYTKWKNKVISDGKKQDFYEKNSKPKVIGVLFLGIGIFLNILIGAYNAVIPISFLIVIVAIIFAVYTFAFFRRTKKGNEHYAKWMAFKKFLNDFGTFETKELPEIALWERYMVYATLFGIAEKVSKSMNVKIKELEETGVYVGGYTPTFNDWYIFNSIDHIITNSIHSNSTAVTQARANSSSSSGSGFGGGFSSGGGFGGGGGGGHGF